MPHYLRRGLPLVLLLGLAGCNAPNPSDSSPLPVAIPPPSGEYHDSVGGLTSPPYPVYQVAPRYPYEYKSNHIQGEAVVSFIVEKDGTVQQASVISATREGFGYAAMQSVLRWRFRPGVKDGQPVRVLLRVPIQFSLTER